MIRPELFHPLISHFPIGLLGCYPIALLLAFKWKEQMLATSRFLLYAGILGVFVSLYLGDMALERILPSLCDIPRAYRHEDQAYYLMYSSILLVLIDVGEIAQKVKAQLAHYLKLLFAFVLVFFLYRSGHTGAELVYDYGAAVQSTQYCLKK